MNLLTTIGTVVAGALLVTATASPAQAAKKPVIDLRGAEVGSYVVDDDGAARLSGRLTGRPFDGAYTAVLAAVDGTLPAPGTCEPATAVVDVTGTRSRDHLELTATGDLCGTWPDATYVVTHDFTGRYEVTDASARRLRGTDGWIGMVLATEGRANLEVFDS